MKEYRVLVREVHIAEYAVAARNEEEAKLIAADQIGDQEPLRGFDHTMGPETWTVELVFNSGWLHMDEPFEIEMDQECDRFTNDDQAREAHRKECDCSWPEFDYVAAFQSWWNSSYSVDVDAHRELWVEICQLMVWADRSTFAVNVDTIISSISRIIDMAEKDKQIEILAAAGGSMALMKQFKADKNIGPFQFTDEPDVEELALKTKRSTWQKTEEPNPGTGPK